MRKTKTPLDIYNEASGQLELLADKLKIYACLPETNGYRQDVCLLIDDVALTLRRHRVVMLRGGQRRNNIYANHHSHIRDIASALKWAGIETHDEAVAACNAAIKSLFGSKP